MKIILITFFILIYNLTAICQETKFVTKKFNSSKQISENYSVLKSDKQTKHGEYISYFLLTAEESKQVKNGIQKLEKFIKLKGIYKNGKKDGEWIEYSRPFYFQTLGNYDSDKKVGIWLTSKEQGQVFERYDFDNNKKLQPIIKVWAKYPKSAQDIGLQGTAIISYQINKDCSITNIILIKGLSSDCDKTAIEALSKTEALLKKYSQICEDKTDTTEVQFNLK